MDPDVRMDRPGKCPRCGMTLALKIPDRVESPISLTVQPQNPKAGEEIHLVLRVSDSGGKQVTSFETVHEKLIHLFLVSEDLEFFAHVHPKLEDDGSFGLTVKLPKAGMYRLLADYYPAGSTPQLSVETLYLAGHSSPSVLRTSLSPQHAENLTASMRVEPDPLLTGLQARLFFTLEPAEGLEKYLGAWGHMLIASEDTIDMMHLHPFLTSTSTIQYNAIFPRPGNYKIWSQYQRLGVVNTVAFTVSVQDI